MSPPSAAQRIAALPPILARPPGSAGEIEEADKHNLAILEVRGFRTTATGHELYRLATSALNNFFPSALVEHATRGRGPFIPVNGAQHATASFEPFYFFFYGSLQVPNVLKRICDLEGDVYDANPLRGDAKIGGWRIKMWGPFPALVPTSQYHELVKGMAWKCEDPRHVAKLCMYETNAYRMAYCTITVPTADGREVETIENARTFVSTLDQELDEGEFDLDQYKKGRYWD